MSRLIQFLENARKALSPAEWIYFNARYIDGKDVAESAQVSGCSDAETMRVTVLHKLRGDMLEAQA